MLFSGGMPGILDPGCKVSEEEGAVMALEKSSGTFHICRNFWLKVVILPV